MLALSWVGKLVEENELAGSIYQAFKKYERKVIIRTAKSDGYY